MHWRVVLAGVPPMLDDTLLDNLALFDLLIEIHESFGQVNLLLCGLRRRSQLELLLVNLQVRCVADVYRA